MWQNRTKAEICVFFSFKGRNFHTIHQPFCIAQARESCPGAPLSSPVFCAELRASLLERSLGLISRLPGKENPPLLHLLPALFGAFSSVTPLGRGPLKPSSPSLGPALLPVLLTGSSKKHVNIIPLE